MRVTRRTLATLRDTLAIAARRARDVDAAHELEASEDAFAVVVDQQHALQRRLAQTESNLRAALAAHARRDR
ncbi:hypothetical protein CFB39_38190 [Burkholderia sp. AU6039]|nr:hypothetical protein CFB39_38190 [Burkholderia sp. AU6039]